MKKVKNHSFYEFIMKVHSISKIGLTYSKDSYALENYEELSELSSTMLKSFTKVDFNRPQYFSKDVYPTPNVSVRMVIFDDLNQVLLVKEKVDGGYTLPGGWADLFESPVEAIRRECMQEAGATVEVEKLSGVYHFDFFHRGSAQSQYALVFKGRLTKPLKPWGHEITDVGFFALNQLPKTLSFKIERKDLVKMIKDAMQEVTAIE
jgi:8-oxo-dGTP pyrophosphatase MutT (NUDIX family)